MQVIVESLLIQSMAAFHFAIVSWCAWTNQFVGNAKFITEFIHRM